MTHAEIWHAIDMIATRNKMSCSRLAIYCGLDPTTFNKSKRWTVYGKPRWPSTKLISKILITTSTSPEEFVRLFNQPNNG